MRKKQKSKAVMYRHIERWKSGGLSGRQYCKEARLTKSTFYYWLKKYRHEKGFSVKPEVKKPEAFIPVDVSSVSNGIISDSDHIEVFFPNGVQVSCPSGIDIRQLKTLINF